MKRYFSFFRAAFVLCCLLSAAVLGTNEVDPNLLFQVNFDAYTVNANQARGQRKSANFKTDLQLRMFPGVNGKGNAFKLHNSEFCAYPMPGNFDPMQGTVSLWISPQNWKFTDKLMQVFFEARQKDFRLLIYKYTDLPYVCFYIDVNKRTETVHAKLDLAKWTDRRWHLVTAVWDRDSMRIYIDGRLPERYNPGDVHPAFPVKEIMPPLNLPKADRDGVIGLGKLFDTRTIFDIETGIDDLRIYNRRLGAAEVLQLYRQTMPEPEREKPADVATVPQTASGIELDGRLDDAEWSNAVRLPLKQAFKIANHQVSRNASVRLKRDASNLYVGFDTDRPTTRHTHTGHDSNVYSDDSMEFFILDPDNRELWFCVNPNGAFFDALDRKREWNSGGDARGFIKPDGGWSAEMIIPLTALGNPKDGERRLANFHALDMASAPYYYLSWNGNPAVAKAGPGYLRFGTPDEAISLENLGELYRGNGVMNIRSGGNFHAEFLNNGTKEISFEGKAGLNEFPFQLTPGSQTLQIVGQKGKETTYSYTFDFELQKPISFSVNSIPSKRLVEVKIDLNAAGSKILRAIAAGMLTGILEFTRDGKVITSSNFTPATTVTARLKLPQELESGKYEIKVILRAKGGEISESMPFRIPDREPYVAKVACDHEVPDPWQEVKESAPGVFQVLDREYDFTGSAFPSQMISRGDRMLASAPELTVDGYTVGWNNFRVAERYPDYVVLTGEGLAKNGFRFPWRGELWFDGLYKLDFMLTPPPGCREVKSLKLSWSVPNEFNRYFMQRNKEFAVIPWRDNQIATPLNIADASWLTGLEKGMMWCPLSTANWNSAAPQAFFLKRGPQTTEVTLDIVGKPSKLSRNADYSIAFMATPGRRPPENFRTYNLGSYLDNRYETIQISSTESSSQKPREDDVLGYAGHRMRDPEGFRKAWIKPYSARNIGIMPYHQPMELSKFDDEFDYYLKEWRTIPGYVQANLKKANDTFDSIQCCGEGIADLHAWRLQKLFEDFPELGGIYYDICDVKECNNTLHGHGGTDAMGKAFKSSTAMSLRNYLMRIYKVTHRTGKKTFLHAHNYFNPIVHNFADLWYPGENEVWLYGENPDYYYCEAPLEEYQCAWNPIIRGTGIIRSNQVTRVLSIVKNLQPRQQEMSSPEFAVRSFVSAWLHDFNIDSDWINNRAVEKFWKIRNEINIDNAKFFGYWFDNAVKSASPGIYCSRYEWKTPSPWKQLIIVGNMTRKNLPAKLKLDWTKLGLTDGKFEMTELWSGKPFTEKDLTEAVVPENHFLLIGIKPR